MKRKIRLLESILTIILSNFGKSDERASGYNFFGRLVSDLIGMSIKVC